MNLLQSLKKLLILALVCSAMVLSHSLYAQTQETHTIQLDFSSSGSLVSELEFYIQLNNAVFDNTVSVTLDDQYSWFLEEGKYSFSVQDHNVDRDLIKIHFYQDSLPKSGIGIVAEVSFGILVVIDDVHKTSDVSASVVDVKPVFADIEAKVYPNPARSTLYWEGLEDGTAMQVIDASGKMMNLILESGRGIDVSAWPRGFYIFRYTQNDKVSTRKVVLN